ncbi:MAG: ComEA family DNA-binding protein [Desulfococcaceae bacterium]
MVFHRNRFWIAALLSVFLFSGLAWGASGKVDINAATADELSTLDGIGPAKANSIVDYRNRHGAFKRPEDLMSVSGIGPKTFEANKDRITIGGESARPSVSGDGEKSTGTAETGAKTNVSESAGSPPAKQ